MRNSNNLKTLTSLALIETQLLSQDYLSTFLPFIATLVIKKEYEFIDLGIIVQDFKEEYGISVPRAPMQSILSKAVSTGLIIHSQDGRFLPVVSEMQKISFLSGQSESNNQIQIILSGFIEFVLNKHNITIDQSEAVDIFINFLDEYSPQAVSSREYDSANNEKFLSNKNLYLMGEFIQSTISTNFLLFETIRKLSMSYLITTALTFDEPVETRTKELSGLTIYLDTPIVLRLLGLQTEELQLAYKEMFDNFKLTINPTLMIFQHTLDEISGIISDCANWIDNAAYNPIYANPALLNFVKKKFSKTQVELYKSTLEGKLLDIGIEIDNNEYYQILNKSSQIDIIKLEKKLVDAYTQNNPQYDVIRNKNSIDYDIRSVENIIKLWGTKSSKSYSRLGYLFITNNSTLAYVSRKFTSEYWWDGKNHKAPCITDYYLGTMVWLSTPANKIESVSKLKLIADCSVATTLSREVMEKFSNELKKLQNEKGIENGDYLLIRKYAYEKNYLQNLTLNEEMAFKDDILEQLLEDIKADIQKPFVETIKEKELQINSLVNEKDEQYKIIKSLEHEKEKELVTQNAVQKEIEELADKATKRMINTFAPISFAIFAFITVILQVTPTFSNLTSFIKVIVMLEFK
ncbi:hypothetical protein [Konateibacter massiliensis]|uniref:hypothetical protein n=1 Tax=Konateibacter massiliensis TaxID=2002841 RepID=UPI000C14A719|nr:hypothetical protein [Konateibacter massiliensis]